MPPSGKLNSDDRKRIDEIADRFESAWKSGQPVDLAPFLPSAADPLRSAALEELIKTDMEYRWRHGRTVDLFYYLERYPELGPSDSLSPALIYEEYLARMVFGDKPSLRQYEKRFPGQFAEFQRLAIQEKTAPSDSPVARSPAASPTVPSHIDTIGADQVIQQTGGYKLLKRIGYGTFGAVWKAEAPGGVLKAIKISFRPVDDLAAQDELRALELIKGLDHEFLMPTDAYWTLEDRLLVLMDLADGSMLDRLKQCAEKGEQGIPMAELLQHFRQTAAALDYLHERKIQHRDIKPENILLKAGKVRVADFGLARSQGAQSMTNNSLAGTPHYVPPEAWQDRVHLHSDQYSLAATYVKLRRGRCIYKEEGATQNSLMLSHLNEPPDLTELVEAEQQVLRTALAKEPRERFPSCTAFVQALEKALMPELAVQPPLSPLEPLVVTTPSEALTDDELGTFGKKRDARPDTDPNLVLPPVPWKGPPPKKATRIPWSYVLIALLTGVSAGLLAWIYINSQPSPLDTLPVAPIGHFRAAGTKEVSLRGKAYYERIEWVLGDMTVPFVFVPFEPLPDHPFYIMENKVCNDLFARFAALNPGAVQWSRWRFGARLGRVPLDEGVLLGSLATHLGANLDGVSPLPLPLNQLRAVLLEEYYADELPHVKDMGISNGKLPVMQVDILEAHRCAVWMGGLLPSAREWDKAAGRFEKNRGKGPFEEDWQPGEIAVGLAGKGPMEVGAAKKDRSRPFGCRDMAGNGLEWTRTLHLDGNPGELARDDEEFLGKISAQALVHLRGQDFADREPLHFEDLEGPAPRRTDFWRTKAGVLLRSPSDANTGFRVVVFPKNGGPPDPPKAEP